MSLKLIENKLTDNFISTPTIFCTTSSWVVLNSTMFSTIVRCVTLLYVTRCFMLHYFMLPYVTLIYGKVVHNELTSIIFKNVSATKILPESKL